MQIYCTYFVGWSTTSLHKLFLDCVYLFYLFLIQLPLTVIHDIVAVDADSSMCPVVPLIGSILGVVVLVSKLSQLLKYQEEYCVVISSMQLQ